MFGSHSLRKSVARDLQTVPTQGTLAQMGTDNMTRPRIRSAVGSHLLRRGSSIVGLIFLSALAGFACVGQVGQAQQRKRARNANCECSPGNGSDHSSAPMERGLTAVLLFFLTLAGIALVGAIGLVQAHGWDSLVDYAAYLLPVLAGIIAGLVIYYPESPRKYFWLPAILLVFGLLSYIATKGVSLKLIAVADVVFALLFTGGILYDERVYRNVRKDFASKFSRAFMPVAFGLMVIVCGYFIWQALKDQPKKCQMILAKPANASIVEKPASTTKATRTSEGMPVVVLELHDFTIIDISPCPKRSE